MSWIATHYLNQQPLLRDDGFFLDGTQAAGPVGGSCFVPDSVQAKNKKNPVPASRFKMNQRPQASGHGREPLVPITQALWRAADLDGYATVAAKKQLRQTSVPPPFTEVLALENQKLDEEELEKHFNIITAQFRVYKKWAMRRQIALPQNMILYASWLKKVFSGKAIIIKNPDGSQTKYLFEIGQVEHLRGHIGVFSLPATEDEGDSGVRRFKICVSKDCYSRISSTGQFYERILSFVLQIMKGKSAKDATLAGYGLGAMLTWLPKGHDQYALELIESIRLGGGFFGLEGIHVGHLIDDAVHQARLHVEAVLHAHDLVVDHTDEIETSHHLAESFMKIGEVFHSTQSQDKQIQQLDDILQSFSYLPLFQRVNLVREVVVIIQHVFTQWCIGKSEDDIARIERMLTSFIGGLLLSDKLHYREKYSALEFLDEIIFSSKNSRMGYLDLIRDLQKKKPPHWRAALGHIFMSIMVGATVCNREDGRNFINYDFGLIPQLDLYRTTYAFGMGYYVKQYPEMIERQAIRNLVKVLMAKRAPRRGANDDVMRELAEPSAGMALRAALKDPRLAQIVLSELGAVFKTDGLSFKQYAEAAAIIYLANEELGLSQAFDAQVPLRESFHLLRQRLLQAPHTILKQEIVSLCASGTNVNEIVDEFLAPLALCRPELFDVDLVNAILANHVAEVTKYLFSYLQSQPMTSAGVEEVIAAFFAANDSFILRDQAKEIIRQAATIAVVHGVEDGLGDELLRNVMLVEALLKENPQAQIVLWTRRPFLYAHPRVKTFDLGEKTFNASLKQLSRYPAEVLLYHDSKYPGEDKIIRMALRARKRSLPPKLYIETNKEGPETSCEEVVLRLEIEGRRENFATRLGLNKWRARNVYDTNYRLLVELGLPILNRRERSPADSVLVATASETTRTRWTQLTASKKTGQPTAIINPFGGQNVSKGIEINNELRQINDHHLLLEWIKRLIEMGYFVVLMPNGTKWGDRKTAQKIEAPLAEIIPDYKSSFVIAPDLHELPPGSLKYFLSYADFVLTIEGWAMHMAAALGKPLEVVFVPGSGDERWIPYARLSDQVVGQL